MRRPACGRLRTSRTPARAIKDRPEPSPSQRSTPHQRNEPDGPLRGRPRSRIAGRGAIDRVAREDHRRDQPDAERDWISALTALQALFEREIRAEATRERIVDRLHAELQEYKQDLLLKVQRPIFIDLIQLHDDIGKMIDAQPLEDPDRAAAVRGTLDSIRTAIEDILYRQGVEPFRLEGEEFDPRRQRAVSTVPTEDPRAQQDHRRPAPPRLPGRRQGHPARDRLGSHAQEMTPTRAEFILSVPAWQSET